jgi:hypothetical protein
MNNIFPLRDPHKGPKFATRASQYQKKFDGLSPHDKHRVERLEDQWCEEIGCATLTEAHAKVVLGAHTAKFEDGRISYFFCDEKKRYFLVSFTLKGGGGGGRRQQHEIDVELVDCEIKPLALSSRFTGRRWAAHLAIFYVAAKSYVSKLLELAGTAIKSSIHGEVPLRAFRSPVRFSGIAVEQWAWDSVPPFRRSALDLFSAACRDPAIAHRQRAQSLNLFIALLNNENEKVALLPEWSILHSKVLVNQQLEGRFAKQILLGEMICRYANRSALRRSRMFRARVNGAYKLLMIRKVKSDNSYGLYKETSALLAAVSPSGANFQQECFSLKGTNHNLEHCNLDRQVVENCGGGDHYLCVNISKYDILEDDRLLQLLHAEMVYNMSERVASFSTEEGDNERIDSILRNYARLSEFVYLSAKYFGIHDGPLLPRSNIGFPNSLSCYRGKVADFADVGRLVADQYAKDISPDLRDEPGEIMDRLMVLVSHLLKLKPNEAYESFSYSI